jgi:hypothetical protein
LPTATSSMAFLGCDEAGSRRRRDSGGQAGGVLVKCFQLNDVIAAAAATGVAQSV